jgi:hypothetical protein
MSLRTRIATWLGRGTTAPRAASSPEADLANHEYLEAKHDTAIASGVGGASPVLGPGTQGDVQDAFESDQKAPARRTP